MPWTRFDYEYSSQMKNHVCHPSAAKFRVNDIISRYGVRPQEVRKVSNLHLDYGGALSTKARALEIEVGSNRTLSTWPSQAMYWAGRLEDQINRSTFKIAGKRFIRVSGFPGFIFYLSAVDAEKAIQCFREVGIQPAIEHSRLIHKAMSKANERSLMRFN